MKWDAYDSAVSAALRVAQDEDIARDAALKALEECGDAPLAHILRRARDRAKDIIRSQRARPQELHQDVDLIASDSNPEREAAEREEKRQITGAVGLVYATILHLVEAGYTNAEIAAKWKVSEEYVRKARKQAEELRSNFLKGGQR
jgi:DNA-directed RNA polymerase specialized sigma24 family protein